MLRIARVGIAHVQQGLVDASDRANNLFFECSRKIGGILQGALLGLLPLIVREIGRADLYQQNRGESEKHAAVGTDAK